MCDKNCTEDRTCNKYNNIKVILVDNFIELDIIKEILALEFLN
jgi:hypothetical protein